MRKTLIGGAAVALVALLAAPAAAHVTANPDEAPGGSFFKTDFRVGHGCDGEPTIEMSVQIPDGVVSVSPQVKTGWRIETEMGELSEPVELHGEEVTEGVQRVTWKATDGGLPDGFMDEFGVSMRVPEEAEDDVLYFPFVQKCEDGEYRWVTIPESLDQWGEVDEPAPYVQLAAAAGGHGGGEDEEPDDEGGAEVEAAPASTTTSADDDGDTGMLLGGLGLGLGAIALVVALMAMRRTNTGTRP